MWDEGPECRQLCETPEGLFLGPPNCERGVFDLQRHERLSRWTIARAG